MVEDQTTSTNRTRDQGEVQVPHTFVAVVEAEQGLVEPREQQLSTNTIRTKLQKCRLDIPMVRRMQRLEQIVAKD